MHLLVTLAFLLSIPKAKVLAVGREVTKEDKVPLVVGTEVIQ